MTMPPENITQIHAEPVEMQRECRPPRRPARQTAS